MKVVLNFEEFKVLREVKHRADLSTGDIIYLSCGTNFNQKDNLYHLTVCDSTCGRDEFAGVRHDGQRVSWGDMDHFIIVNRQILINELNTI